MRIKFDAVSADYQLGPIKKQNVLLDITAELKPGSFTAVVGQTGAGKSSLLKVVNGLVLPTRGQMMIGDISFSKSASKSDLSTIRKRVGMAFQFPEHQLFAETVYDDVAFGPKNFGFNDEEIEAAVIKSCQLVGIDEILFDRSPFSLSGGQQRRVALAGILAVKPDILVLDEPAAGLDPLGKKTILDMLKKLHETENLTTLMVTHDMDDVSQYADEVIVMDNGELAEHLGAAELFAREDLIERYHLELPEAMRLQKKLEENMGKRLNQRARSVEALADLLIEEGWV